MLCSMTGYGRYQRNPTCISGVCALDTKDLHAAQVGKHSTLSKIMLLITLTMKCTFSQSCFFFSFIYGSLFFWGLIIAWYFFFFDTKKLLLFLTRLFYLSFIRFFGGCSGLTWISVITVSGLEMIHIRRPWKLSNFQDPPLTLSIYVQNSSTPLPLDVQFQTNIWLLFI